MSRFFTDSLFSPIILKGEDVKHMYSVLRLRAGDSVTLCDGRGHECEAVITDISKETAVLTAGEIRNSSSEATHRITLFQCLPKTGKMETVIQKSTELGFCALRPVVSEYCVALPGKDFDKKRERYAKVAEEAAKQSRRGIIPEILPVINLGDADLAGFDTVLLAYEAEHTVSLKQALASAGTGIALIIGPEGGFSETEVKLLQAKGAVSVSLGPRILRTETAGPAAIAQILFCLEE